MLLTSAGHRPRMWRRRETICFWPEVKSGENLLNTALLQLIISPDSDFPLPRAEPVVDKKPIKNRRVNINKT